MQLTQDHVSMCVNFSVEPRGRRFGTVDNGPKEAGESAEGESQM